MITAIAVWVETERVNEIAHLAFDLGTLQEICSKKLGLAVLETLNVAQALLGDAKGYDLPPDRLLPAHQHATGGAGRA